MRAFVAGIGAAIVIALLAVVISDTIDFRSKDIYQSHNGSVRLSAQ